MEFAPVQVAKLVLGYLKSEKCQKAYDLFLETSRHLRSCSDVIKRKKYVVTRVNGYSLEDYLKEFGEVYTLINERLEATEYFVENRLKSLSDQLLYLLENPRVSRPCTPSRSRSSTPYKDRQREPERLSQDLSVIEEEVVEPNATSLDDLPGNGDVELENDETNRENGGTAAYDSYDENDGDLSVKVLTQLLDYHELHEKLAENINLVRNKSDSSVATPSVVKTSAVVDSELDLAIKAIVQRTEADPIFEKFVDDIMESVNDAEDEQPDGINNDIQDDILHNGSERSEPSLSTPVKSTQSPDTIKQRLRSSRKPYFENQPIVGENEAAPTTENLQKTQPGNLVQHNVTADVHKNLNINANTGDIIFYDGSLENYMQTSTTVTSSNPLLLGNSLLMMQPTVASHTPATSVVNTLDASKPYYLLNSSQIVSVPQYNVNNITEQDILTMPTVIVCDDKRQTVPPQNIVTQRFVKQPGQKKLTTIAPKDCTDIAENLSEFITLYPNSDATDKPLPVMLSKQVPKARRPKPKVKKPSPPTIQIRILKPTDEAPNEPDPIKQEVVDITQTEEKQPEKEQGNVDTATQVSNNTTPDVKRQCSRRSLSTPKSSSMSHVRALDFNFGTPGNSSVLSRRANTSPKTCKKSSTKISTKISKSLFCSPSKKTAENDTQDKVAVEKTVVSNSCEKTKVVSKGDWDANLRAVMGPVSDRCPTPKRKRKDSAKAKKTVKKIVNMNETEVDAKAIEAALSTPTPVEAANKESPGGNKIANKRRRRIRAQNVISPKKIVRVKTNRDVKEKIEEKPVSKTPDIEEQDLTESSVIKVKENEVENETNEVAFRLINCNAKARFRKKCNIDNNVKKEVKVTKVKEIKSLEFISDGTNKLILSPSKLNANKRNIVDEGERVEEIVDKAAPTQVNFELNSSKFITPEMPKVPAVQQPITAARNLTPMLETPVKIDVFVPKTPGIFSPANNLDTPFTKVFKEQLQGVDISTIETPKFPLTPNFPFTPFQSGSSYPHRSTDYSTSSSYYQPSDSEQNKSLEQLIIDECKRLETKQPTPVKTERDEKPQDLKETNKPLEEDLVHKVIAEKMKSLSQNVIGRKNLNLMKAVVDDASSGENSSSNWDSSSSSDDNSDCWVEGSNETVVEKADITPRYSLRPRKDGAEKMSKDTVESTKVIRKILTQTDCKTTLVEKIKPMSFQEKVLKQLEEKRKRIIGQLKNDSMKKSAEKRKAAPKKKTTALINNPKATPGGKNRRKSSTPKKIDAIAIIKNADVATKMTVTKKDDDEIVLHLSSDGEQLQPFDVVETELLEGSTSSTPHPTNSKDSWPPTSFHHVLGTLATEKKQSNSDVEAETLVKGLKEWGIHLVPNKSPKKITHKDAENSNAPLKTPSKQLIKTDDKNAHESLLEEGEIVSDDERDAKIPKNIDIVPNETKGTVEQDLNLSESTTEVTFDIVTFTSHITVVHDYNKKSNKRLEDYNFNLLNKDISAKVYIEDSDVEIEKKMTVTPHECVLDIPEKITSRDRVKILDCVTIASPKMSALNSLYYELFDKPIETSSPLNDLYKPQESNRYGGKKSDPKSRIKATDVKLKARRVSVDQKTTKVTPRYNRSKSLDQKLVGVRFNDAPDDSKKPKPVDAKPAQKSTKDNVKRIKTERKKDEVNRSKTVESSKHKKCDKSKDAKVADVEAKEVVSSAEKIAPIQSDNLDRVVGVQNFNSKEADSPDLMDYAICGSERVENSDTEIVKISSAKRKATDESSESTKRPKTNCQELLKKIDVDSFLKKLHGEK